jgi:glycerophosphoryl diester phosphodiesterase
VLGVADAVVGEYLPGSHAHNDYDRTRPLTHALALGFASIEVDVALTNGVLYVTHDSMDIPTERTFREMYVEPLKGIVEARGGSLYPPPSPPLQLLVDVKSDADEAYRALDALLSEYPRLFTHWNGTTMIPGPVIVVLSGNRASALLVADPERRMALDGRIWEDREGISPEVMPLVSINWDDTVGPRGQSRLAERLAIAGTFARAVHAEGRRVRFWGTPDRDRRWAELLEQRVDFIGTDDVERLARFLRRTTPGMHH